MRYALTSGRYMVGNIAKIEATGHPAALGYFDDLASACEFAHSWGSSLHPVGVYDSYIRRTDAGIRSQEVHRTHGERPALTNA